MKLISYLVPRSWRETVLRDLEDEARERGHGRLWVAGQLMRIGLRLAPALNGDAMVFDLRYALRALWRSKAFAVGAALTFAIGIGVNVAVFSIVDRMTMRPLPYGNAGRLFVMGEFTPDSPNPYGTLEPRYVVETRQRHQGVVDLAVTDQATGYTLEPNAGAVLAITEGSYNVLDVLGVRPLLGRTFTEDDVRAGRRGVVISFDAWQGRLGGRADVIGQRLWSEGEPIEIIGVLPSGFYTPESMFGGRSDGIGLNPSALRLPYPERVRETPPIVRLKDGVSVQAAEAELNGLMAAVRQDLGTSTTPSFFRLVPLRESMFGRYTKYTWLVILAASLVLLMCCANLASLMLVRARSREHHTALQLALGASRYRVIRSALVESLLLSGTGTITALLVVVWTHGALRAFVPAVFGRYSVDPTDVRVLAFSLVATVVCALIAGVGPVLRTTSSSAAALLQHGGGRSAAAGRRGRSLVLGAEALIAVLLVSGAAMTGRSLVGLTRVDLGFAPDGLHFVGVQYAPPSPDPAVRFRQYTEALEALRRTPGVEAVAAADVLPIMGAAGNRFLGNGSYSWRITDEFVKTMGIPMLAGRDFTEREVVGGAAVALVSELGLARMWPGVSPHDAIGRVIHLEGVMPSQVVGVVGDVRGSGAAPADPSLYLPITADKFRILRFVARTAAAAAVPLEEAQRRLASAGNPGQVSATPVNNRLVSSLRDQRFRATLFGSFAVVGLVLACVGLYAVTAFEVRQRQVEMGVRLALGATPTGLQRLALWSALAPVAGGTIAGLVIAWWTGEYLQSFLHRVDARDPGTLAGVGAVLILAGTLAAWIPARRASRVDPAIVLRSQ